MSTTLIVEQEETVIAPLIAMQEQAMAIIRDGSLRDILKAHSELEAMKRYVKKQRHCEQASVTLSEMAAQLARRGGELLRSMDRARAGSNQWSSHDETTTLKDMGLSKSQSSRWQAIAAIPEQTFRHQVNAHVSKSIPITLKHLLKFAPKKQEENVIVQMPTAKDRGVVVSNLSELGEQKFSTIYADPPWSYGNQATRACTDKHYVTMSVPDICAMPVKDYAAENAQLHLCDIKTKSKGPRLQGSDIVLPDFEATIGLGRRIYIDAKVKKNFAHFRNRNEDRHGIDKRYWEAYRAMGEVHKQRSALGIVELFGRQGSDEWSGTILFQTLGRLGEPRPFCGVGTSQFKDVVTWPREWFTVLGTGLLAHELRAMKNSPANVPASVVECMRQAAFRADPPKQKELMFSA